MNKDQVRHEETRYRILTEVGQQITSILDINELLEQVVRLIQKTLGYYHVGIGLIEGEDVVYRLGAGALWDNPNFQFKPARLKVGSEGVTGWVAATGEAALVPDVTRDSHYVWMQGSQTRSELTVPITVKGRIIGVLDVQSERLDDFDQTDTELMKALANQTGIAIENAHLFTEAQRLLKQTEERNAELASINSLQLGLASKLDIKGIYELVGEQLRGIFGVHNIVIYSFDHARQLVVDEYAVEKGMRYEIPPQKMTVLHKEIIETGETLFIQENAKGFFEKRKHAMPAGEMPRSMIVVPFKSQGRVAGMIGLFDIDKEFAFKESDVRLMETLTNSMVVALESARLFAETQRLLKETEQRANKLAIINSVQQGLASKLDIQSIYDLVGDHFRDIFNAQVVMISSYDQQSNTVEHRYAIERGERVYSSGSHPPGGFRSKIIQTRQPVMVNTNVAEEAARLGQPTLPATR
jgi:GAF domain-containing protein